MNKKFEIFEDNGGNLYLVTFDKDGQPDYFADSYEEPGHLREDLEALRNGADPVRDGWENGAEDPAEAYDRLTAYSCGWKVVANNDGMYLEHAGEAARRELGRKKKEYKKISEVSEMECRMGNHCCGTCMYAFPGQRLVPRNGEEDICMLAEK